jgi:hypothetical protein
MRLEKEGYLIEATSELRPTNHQTIQANNGDEVKLDLCS